MRAQQLLLLVVDLSTRLDLDLRRPGRTLRLAPPRTGADQQSAPILAYQPHVHRRRSRLGLQVPQVRKRPIDLELVGDRVELRQRGPCRDNHVVIRI